MKNYIREGQKLPLYGVGPAMIFSMAVVTAIGIVLFPYVFQIGTLGRPWILAFRILGGILIVSGVAVWLIGAVGSGMDDNIAENRLKTDGIYAWVRNPMYTGWWFLLTGVGLMWHNIWILVTVVINWGIMTIVLKHTEEKWLRELYHEEYEVYCRRVNRCLPWFPRKVKK